MKPGVAALGANRRAVVGAIGGGEPSKVIIESPAPLHGSGVEDPGATARLVDGHPPVILLVRPVRPGIAAELFLGWDEPKRTDGILVTHRIQLTTVGYEALVPA